MTYAPFTLTCPSRIIFEIGGAARLAQELASFRRILLVTGSHFSGTEDFDKIMESLRGFEVRHESGIHPEPPLEDVDRLICAGREFKADCVVAIGGGSIIDSAKAAAALIPLDGWCADYFTGKKEIPGKGLFFAALPTSSGTGAEITNNSVLTDPATKIKKSLRHPSMVADVAIADPVLTLSCPPSQTAASGLDAFVQAFESCTSPKASSVSRALSYAAIRRIRENLLNACRYPSVLDYRTGMSEGSLLSAMAFSQTGLGAIHGLAHPIGSLLHVPHGKACATLIPAIVACNLPCCREEYAAIARECGFGSAAEDFLDGALELCRALEVRADFSEYGLNESHFDFIVKNCRSASMKLNPRPMTDDDVRELLKTLV